MKKYWVTWKIKGQKLGVEVWHWSTEQAASVIMSKYKPKAIPYTDKYKK